MYESEKRLISAAIRFWENYRPIGWNLEQHLKNHLVNSRNEVEDILFWRVASVIRSRRRKNKQKKKSK